MTDREVMAMAYKTLKELSSFLYGGHRPLKIESAIMALEVALGQPDRVEYDSLEQRVRNLESLEQRVKSLEANVPSWGAGNYDQR